MRSFNPTFREAMDELLAGCQAHELPDVVADLVVAVLKQPIKLFCWVGDAEFTAGAPRVAPGFYASDLLVKLLEAVRTLNWEGVIRLLKHALLPLPRADLGREPTAED